ncbi:MAG: endolytic transglycosylase MltG [Spirochaetales bacterium]|nr:endolytic transglycosylase MltG [Spirochaetales bacterium]
MTSENPAPKPKAPPKAPSKKAPAKKPAPASPAKKPSASAKKPAAPGAKKPRAPKTDRTSGKPAPEPAAKVAAATVTVPAKPERTLWGTIKAFFVPFSLLHAVIVCLGVLLLALVVLLMVLNRDTAARPAASQTPVIQSAVQPETVSQNVVQSNSGATLSIKMFNGWTIADIDNALATRNLAAAGAFIEAAGAVAEEKGLPFAEGFFLAGDYTVQRGRNFAYDLASQMAQAWMDAARALFDDVSQGAYSLAQYAVIASMISAETKNPDEFALISSVIHNRLEAGMPLGIDATTRYETGDWTNPLTPEILENLTPYNTRRKVGLPPTGICCPSEETLRAAVLPARTDYFYYRHDKSGTIHLSRTYEEHLLSQTENP